VGIVILSVVLSSVGVPLEGVALIIGIDRILELFRTATNVTGDLVACVVIDRFVKGPSYEQELQTQVAVEQQQEETGEDVVTGEFAQSSDEADGLLDRFVHFFRQT